MQISTEYEHKLKRSMITSESQIIQFRFSQLKKKTFEEQNTQRGLQHSFHTFLYLHI